MAAKKKKLPPPPLPPVTDYDPAPEDREWYRHINGQEGWLLIQGGKKKIQWNRPNETVIVPFSAEWEAEPRHRDFTLQQVTQVAFTADRDLCRLMGDHERYRQKWEDMPESQQGDWRLNGPQNPRLRQELYQAIMGVMRPLAKS